ncbi:GGDEF domain-containing protein [Plesiomonas sp. ZOR0011]|uniref:GGDEF domain-containing protein n=1 Tax=Plesiomonas sp. ZOR0011 TaxID=1339230 RepID=UPI00064708AD|nr:GGDEF domain-containing protein [Plesiomonas sp. ZOR0011]
MDITKKDYIDKLNELHEITFQLSRAKSEDDIYKIAVEGAISKLDVDRMAIFILDSEYIVRGTYGTDNDGLVVNESNFITSINRHPFALEMLKSRTPMAFKNDIELQYNFENVGVGWSGYITLWDGAQPIGWMACDNLLSAEPLCEKKANNLLMLGYIVSQSIVRLRLNNKIIEMNNELVKRNKQLNKVAEELEALAFIDSLTNIANRRGLEYQLNMALAKNATTNKTMSVIIFDIDDFKLINDSFGHHIGDVCLINLASSLGFLFYGYDFIFSRYGGDEFVVVLFNVTEIEVKSISDSIVRLARKEKINTPKGVVSITVSVGAVTSNIDATSKQMTLIELADKNLYLAKERGKNQAVST